MKIIFSKKFMILCSIIAMIASISLYIFNGGKEYDPVYTISSLVIFKYAYTFDNWERLVKYRKYTWKYIVTILFSLVVGMVASALMFYQPTIYNRMDDAVTNLILNILRILSITIYGILFYKTIKIDKTIEKKLRNTLKCSNFEECTSCYKKSCINCKECDNKMTKYDSIRAELIKEDKFYSKRLGFVFDRILKKEIRELEVEILKSTLKDKYKNEEFNDLYNFY